MNYMTEHEAWVELATLVIQDEATAARWLNEAAALVPTESLDERGLSVDNLMELTHDTDDEEDIPSIRVVSRAEMAKIMSEQDVVLSF